MDFRFTRDEEQFRQEIKDYLDQSMSPDLKAEIEASGGPSQAGDTGPLMREFVEQLSRDGMLTMGWPEEYGGKGLTGLKGYVASEEFARAGIGRPNNTSVSLVGPTIMRVGTEEQKAEWLPKMASGEVQCSLGYTEPGAGTDLAGLQTRAVQDGDEWVISGQKIYNGGAHENTHNWLLARTDPDAPKHRGISFLLCDMNTPGLTVNPIVNMAGDHNFNMITFDNVRVPKKNLVGEQDRGWYVGATLLDFERSGVDYSAGARKTLEELINYSKSNRLNGELLADNEVVRNRLADLAIEVDVSRLISYNIAWMQSEGLVPNKESSMGKVFGTELQQHISQTGMQMLGLHGQLAPGSKHAVLEGRINHMYLSNVSETIAAGTSEIQRNIIATRGLGLPRG